MTSQRREHGTATLADITKHGSFDATPMAAWITRQTPRALNAMLRDPELNAEQDAYIRTVLAGRRNPKQPA